MGSRSTPLMRSRRWRWLQSRGRIPDTSLNSLIWWIQRARQWYRNDAWIPLTKSRNASIRSCTTPKSANRVAVCSRNWLRMSSLRTIRCITYLRATIHWIAEAHESCSATLHFCLNLWRVLYSATSRIEQLKTRILWSITRSSSISWWLCVALFSQ